MISLVENQTVQAELLTDKEKLRLQVELAVNKTPAIDVHTHVYPPAFNGLFLSGIDDLLTYHYLIAETLRSSDLSHACFWKMSKVERADLVWQTLFVDSTPLSEAARGIVTILDSFDLDTRSPNLDEARAFFGAQDEPAHLDRVLQMAGVSDVVMTNDPFSEQEVQSWVSEIPLDDRFHASLRMDTLLNDWPAPVDVLAKQDFKVSANIDSKSCLELRRFLDKWILRMRPVYMAVSLPADFQYPAEDARNQLLRDVVMPTARAHSLSLALMSLQLSRDSTWARKPAWPLLMYCLAITTRQENSLQVFLARSDSCRSTTTKNLRDGAAMFSLTKNRSSPLAMV